MWLLLVTSILALLNQYLDMVVKDQMDKILNIA